VFEPRYVSMVKDAMEGDRLIAVALLKAGYAEDYEGSPAIHPVVCVGQIVRCQPTSTGTYDLLLYGLFRAGIEEEVPSKPFRRAKVQVLQDRAPRSQLEQVVRQMRRAFALVPGRHGVITEMRRIASQLRGVDAAAGRYADALAYASDLRSADRYEILAEPDVLKRFQRLVEMLEHRAAEDAPPTAPGQDPALN
jgi:Lon protease-like protein